MSYKTEQESFWAGEFGKEYINRNNAEEAIATNIALFSNIFKSTNSISSVIEFGANIGINLQAIKQLLPSVDVSAVEINPEAVKLLKSKISPKKISHCSILDYNADKLFDLVLIKGVLIHLEPEELPNVYSKLYESADRYICIAEYYNPTPIEVPYRGFSKKLFKRDFAGEILDMYPDLELVDYGFVYHRDNNFKQDDLTWFLLEKKQSS
ncbi:pseudaminic acid biosynthesis-associated methylase [Pseudoalteromonas phenolica]|uniref:Pseudaminic acid biosynthesis-associated methylase n=1 Tax=Pseudoalteromonas phenolica TaxID=161398 RepID=A0A5R9PZ35_9GAMM|nr:pseudaminic acid biosynthesis-associated methylase [Pseudoalteromonas phenolica]TLX45935.1 pseudaminic acid biosynthesis-associated methylase [Pseudoalteromonas phenolica]